MQYNEFPRQLGLPLALAELLYGAATAFIESTRRPYRLRGGSGPGATLRPGKETPLWNELRAALRYHLRKRGQQAELGRLLSLPRQRVNAFVTGGSQMPDAERTLALLAWLIAVQRGRRPRP